MLNDYESPAATSVPFGVMKTTMISINVIPFSLVKSESFKALHLLGKAVRLVLHDA